MSSEHWHTQRGLDDETWPELRGRYLAIAEQLGIPIGFVRENEDIKFHFASSTDRIQFVAAAITDGCSTPLSQFSEVVLCEEWNEPTKTRVWSDTARRMLIERGITEYGFQTLGNAMIFRFNTPIEQMVFEELRTNGTIDDAAKIAVASSPPPPSMN